MEHILFLLPLDSLSEPAFSLHKFDGGEGRMLTKDNMQFLTPAEIQEWADAAEEYKKLAACR